MILVDSFIFQGGYYYLHVYKPGSPITYEEERIEVNKLKYILYELLLVFKSN